MDIREMKELKKLYRLTYEKIAKQTGLPLGTVRKVFTGETANPRLSTITSLDQFFQRLKVSQGVLSDKDEKPLTLGYGYIPRHPDRVHGGMVMERPAYYAGHEPANGDYTIADYYALPEDPRVELIDGVFYDIAAPNFRHQRVAGEVYRQIANYIFDRGGSCIPGMGPIDVQLDCDEYTMVQPDVLILCDKHRNLDRNIYGAPDFVLEVISLSTRRRDYTLKLKKYEAAGVREYWIVDTYKEQVSVYFFESDDCPQFYPLQGKIPVNIYNGDLEIDMDRIGQWAKNGDA